MRHYLKGLAQIESTQMGQKMLMQALGAEGFEGLPDHEGPHAGLWDRLLRFTGSRSREELLTDIGLGKRVAHIVAKRLVGWLGGAGQDALRGARVRRRRRGRATRGGDDRRRASPSRDRRASGALALPDL